MIRAVVFDVGRVLVQWDMALLLRQFIADPAELAWFAATVITPEWHFQHDAGRSAADLVAERSAEFPAYAPVIEAWFARFNETIPGPVPGSTELVEELAARGMPLYAITNFGADTWAGFAPTFALRHHFRDIVVSGHEKLAKPDPAIFHLAQARFGHPAGQMLFIDDSEANVLSARACGWQAHHFIDAQGLAAELRARGLVG